MKRHISVLVLTAAAALLLATAAAAVEPDPYPPVPGARPAETAAPAAPSGEPSGETSSGEPSAEGAEAAAPLPLVPGTYKGSDGSVLKVKADGTCTYAADVSGTVNGKAMSGRLTFHGTVEGGVFSFTKVTYFGLDLTEIARASGFEDASYWERAAAIIYADGLAL